MGRVLLKGDILDKLDLTSHLEMCDEAGHVLGYFVPVSSASPSTSREPPPLDEAEWRRRENEPPGRTIAEILRDLEACS